MDAAPERGPSAISLGRALRARGGGLRLRRDPLRQGGKPDLDAELVRVVEVRERVVRRLDAEHVGERLPAVAKVPDGEALARNGRADRRVALLIQLAYPVLVLEPPLEVSLPDQLLDHFPE